MSDERIALLPALESLSLAGADAASPAFAPFPRLPTELRLHVWRCTFDPRIIELHVDNAPPSPRPATEPNDGLYRVRFRTLCAPPVALRVTRESRAEALRHYRPAFDKPVRNGCAGPVPPLIYVDFARDTIYLDAQTSSVLLHRPQQPHHVSSSHPLRRFLSAAGESAWRDLRYFAIDEKIWLASRGGASRPLPHLPSEREFILHLNARNLRHFEGLKELIIVHHGVHTAVPCAYSYLRTYDMHLLFMANRDNLWNPYPTTLPTPQLCHRPPLSVVHEHRARPRKIENPQDEFIRYLDKPGWAPRKRKYPQVVRHAGISGHRRLVDEKEWDRRYNEVGSVPITGPELEALQKEELAFFDLGEEDFMDGLRRGCVAEDRKALEEAAEQAAEQSSEEGRSVPIVRSVGLMRGGKEC